MPPAPKRSRISYGPSRVPAFSGMMSGIVLRSIFLPGELRLQQERVVVLDINVVLCQREGRIARFGGGVELLVVHSILQVPVIQQRNAPAVSVLLYEEFHVVVLG